MGESVIPWDHKRWTALSKPSTPTSRRGLTKWSEVKWSEVKWGQVMSSHIKSSQVKPSKVTSSQVRSSHIKSSQVISSPVTSSLVTSHQVTSSLLHYQQTFSTFAQDAVSQPHNTLCCSTAALHTHHVSAPIIHKTSSSASSRGPKTCKSEGTKSGL